MHKVHWDLCRINIVLQIYQKHNYDNFIIVIILLSFEIMKTISIRKIFDEETTFRPILENLYYQILFILYK